MLSPHSHGLSTVAYCLEFKRLTFTFFSQFLSLFFKFCFTVRFVSVFFYYYLCATAIIHSVRVVGGGIHRGYISNHHMMASTVSLSAPSGAVRFTRWNVKGLNSPVKRNKVINHLKSLNTKIAFLQETHLTPLDHVKLRRLVGQLYHSSCSSKARGEDF